MTQTIIKFSEIQLTDVSSVGGKNASLGEMFNNLSGKGIRVPDGFATTAFAFQQFLTYNSLHEPLFMLMKKLDTGNFTNLQQTGEAARQLILQGKMPRKIQEDISRAYKELTGGKKMAVAVRSSATAEDLPEASFAGQHESFLNVQGEEEVIRAVHQCYASLYTDRAIKYRIDNHFAHEKVSLSAGIQRMVRSDLACSGVAFTLDPETGFRDIIMLSGVWGLGENLVQGTVNPDEFFIFKPTLVQHYNAIIQKKLGDKLKTLVYSRDGSGDKSTTNKKTPKRKQGVFVLSDEEILTLGRWCIDIENRYKKPMDIEWAKDGKSGELFIVQARPETVQSRRNPLKVTEYSLLAKGVELVRGSAIGTKTITGKACILTSPADINSLTQDDILVTGTTSPDWDPVLKKARGIITDKGGRTSHASIVARELGVPAVVGCNTATTAIKHGETITLCCSQGSTGFVYRGALPVRETIIDLSSIQKPSTVDVMLIAADPEQAFRLSFYPNDGVGLLRMEFIITHFIQAHPMALARYNDVKDIKAKKQIQYLTRGYTDKKRYFTDTLAQGIAMIAAAFYPKDVIVRMSDFKTNEYANLTGGKQFEPVEENPMLGFRGASRYYHPMYQEGFEMECAAIKEVREKMGLTNVKIMIPFCRTIGEGKKVVQELSRNGLDRAIDETLEIYVMAEIPSNVLLAEQFAKIFDGFSIGSNDLTQLTLGVDRDSSIVSELFNEEDPAPLQMISSVIRKAKNAGVKIGLCGQAPSDLPSFARLLVTENIDSISFTPDAILKGIQNINKVEKELLEKQVV